MQYLFLILLVFSGISTCQAQEIGVLKYKGGGDWYGNPTALPNLIAFCNKNIGTALSPEAVTVEPGSTYIFRFPFIYMTGHGNVFFSEEDAENLRTYLLGGGFLHIDDNYGMDKYIRTEISKVFPNNELLELPANHPTFSSAFKFPHGIPKIHEHDGARIQTEGRDGFLAAAWARRVPVDAGFRGFALRSSRRCRLPAELVQSRLAAEHMGPIVDIQVERLGRLLADRKISLDLSDGARAWLGRDGGEVGLVVLRREDPERDRRGQAVQEALLGLDDGDARRALLAHVDRLIEGELEQLQGSAVRSHGRR